MSHRRLSLVWLCVVVLVIAGVAYLFYPRAISAPLPTKWTPQPDGFPLGTVLAGSTVEMSVGCLGDARPPPLPTWFSRLPFGLEGWAVRIMHWRHAAGYRREWRVQVDMPEFLTLDRAEVGYHSVHGPFPSVEFRLTNAVPGNYDGSIQVRLIRRGIQTNTVTVPIKATVLANPTRWKVLLTASPFEKSATGLGRELEPLTAITSRLAERGVRVDLLRELPQSLKEYDVVLVGGSVLTAGSRQPGFTNQLHDFVAGGGRLIVAADAFYVGTATVANPLLQPYGLELDTKEAQPSELKIQEIVPDRFTTGVSELNFWRGVYLWSTDGRQAKVLAVRQGDAEIGFLGVSRAAGRGDVIVLPQSLWWYRLADDGNHADNARLLENLLGP